ncbi:MAG: hypothetical protein Kow0074_20150 [Candidatus Zixiibacteriota bacterium]
MSSDQSSSVDDATRSGNDYSTWDYGSQNKYHTGVDMVSGWYLANPYGTPVKAAAAGVVEKVFRVPYPDGYNPPNQTRCDGTSDVALDSDNHGLGNCVIIRHANGKFTLYGHLDCIAVGISTGVSVSAGETIGRMGNSGKYARRDASFGPHLHFEIKDRGVLENPRGPGTHYGYTPDLPDGYGYHDPRVFIHPFSSSTITPVGITIVDGPLRMRTGPGTLYAYHGGAPKEPHTIKLAIGQKFVAFEQSGSWYRIWVPHAAGPSSIWVSALHSSCTGGTCAQADPTAPVVSVCDPLPGGVSVRTGPGTGFPRVTARDASTNVLIWDGQAFINRDSDQANGVGCSEYWYKLHLPGNATSTEGWSCGEYICPTCQIPATPGAPSTSNPSPCANAQYTISWNAVGGATGYELYENGSKVYDGPNTSWPTSHASGSYSYTVKAKNSCGSSGSSSSGGSTTIQTAPGTPGAPSTSNASPCANAQYTISWNAVGGATGYELYENGSKVYDGPNTSWLTSHASGSYSYELRAKNDCGLGSLGPTDGFTAVRNLAPPYPGSLTPGNGITGLSDTIFSWAPDPCAERYQVRFNSGPGLCDAEVVWKDTTVSGPSVRVTDVPSAIWWCVRSIRAADTSLWAGPETYTDVADDVGGLIPRNFSLNQNRPNPFNSGTVIEYYLSTIGSVRLEVFDILGRRVVTLVNDVQMPGLHTISWDGVDQNGNAVTSGLYFYRITAVGESYTRKMVVLR